MTSHFRNHVLLGLYALFLNVVACTPNDLSTDGASESTPVSNERAVAAESETGHEQAKIAPPKNSEQAIDQFVDQARRKISDAQTPGQEFVSRTIDDRKHLHARRLKCTACAARLNDTLTATERQTLILHGSIVDLEKHSGECWQVESYGGFGNSLSGYLEADTGRLIVLWVVPEG